MLYAVLCVCGWCIIASRININIIIIVQLSDGRNHPTNLQHTKRTHKQRRAHTLQTTLTTRKNTNEEKTNPFDLI